MSKSEDDKIPSKEDILKGLERHYTITLQYLELMALEGDNLDTVPCQNWNVHGLVGGNQDIADYFSEPLAEESKQLFREMSDLVKRCEEKAYSEYPLIQEKNFPWFDELDLQQNLDKTLTIEQMAEFGSHGTASCLTATDRFEIQKNCFRLVASGIISSKLYQRKKDLEKRMIDYLKVH